MVNYDPIDYYCFLIQESINEGGSRIKEPRAGITTDMSGRWTIKAFDTDKKNKKETPSIEETEISDKKSYDKSINHKSN
jgi:hypothetical protein